MLDHGRRILGDLPGALDDDGEQQRGAEGDRQAGDTADQPEQPVEQEAVDDVGEGVPVGDVLGVLGGEHLSLPELHIAAFADRLAAQRQQDRRGGGHE